MSIKSFVSFTFTCAAAAAFVLTTAGRAQAQECGDVDENGQVTAADALGVLRSAVGLGALHCRTGDFVALEAAVAANTAAIALKAELPCASQVGDNVIFNGCNVHVRSGAGATDAAVNGLGNLIVGYDEYGGYGANGGIGVCCDDDKAGSHNLVVGSWHTYSNYGGFVAGYDNRVTGKYSSVSGGVSDNAATGDYTSVSGGYNNTASGKYSSVSGGLGGIASGDQSSISGGQNNIASGTYSSVSGGETSEARGWSSIVSGVNNLASGNYSSVSGGGQNIASGHYSSISGGLSNTAIGHSSSVSGGYSNTASGDRSSVSGGNTRTAAGIDDWAAGALFEDQ
jgi:hypothetical protein